MRYNMHRILLIVGVMLISACSMRPPSPTSDDAKPLAPSDTLAQPDANPILRIETGMHSARIWRIDVDSTEQFLVTASDDKTARVWDLATRQLLQVLRPPIGDSLEG